MPAEVLRFAALDGLGWLRHGFVCRVPDVPVNCGREEALRRLEPHHREALREAGLDGMRFVTAEQVHGSEVACAEDIPVAPAPGADALIGGRSGSCLGIYVADCAAVFLADTRNRAIGLAHSGRKGTELGVVPRMIAAMEARYGSRPEDLVAAISPCIRPPRYEVDFAAEIVAQCRRAGVSRVEDGGLCTGADLARFYSYRMESGRTGRMLAFAAVVAATAA